MVGVMIIKTREQHFPFVIFIITVVVLEEDKAATLRHIQAVMGNFETYWYMKIVRKVDLLIRFSVVVCVFKNN